MTADSHTEPAIELAFAAPLDLGASLAPLGRAGDDLIDRFDGAMLVRTVRLDPYDQVVAYAADVVGDADRPSLTVRAAHSEPTERNALAAAIRASLLTDRSALLELAASDAAVRELVERYVGLVPVLFGDPLTALVRSISAQQINLRWAAVVRARLAQRYGTRHEVGGTTVWSLHPGPLAEARLEDLRATQLTTAKSRAIVACAEAALAGELRLADLRALSDDQLIAHLVGLRGIGRWSAEWFLARTLGRPRVVCGDLGVRKAVGRLYGASVMPSEIEVRRLTGHWGAAATHAQALALHDLATQP